MGVADRIVKILEDTNLSARAFEISIGKTSGYLNMLVKRESSPSTDVIQKIVEVYPQYSLRWIITGMGSMYAKNENILREETEKYQREDPGVIDAIIDRRIKERVEGLKDYLIESITREIRKELLRPEKED